MRQSSSHQPDIRFRRLFEGVKSGCLFLVVSSDSFISRGLEGHGSPHSNVAKADQQNNARYRYVKVGDDNAEDEASKPSLRWCMLENGLNYVISYTRGLRWKVFGDLDVEAVDELYGEEIGYKCLLSILKGGFQSMTRQSASAKTGVSDA